MAAALLRLGVAVLTSASVKRNEQNCNSQKQSLINRFFFRKQKVKVPIDSLKPGSSETLSSLDRNPLRVRNALSRTPLSTSVVSGHRAGRMRLATSCNKKYCCVAANANILAILAGGKGSRVPRIKAPISTY